MPSLRPRTGGMIVLLAACLVLTLVLWRLPSDRIVRSDTGAMVAEHGTIAPAHDARPDAPAQPMDMSSPNHGGEVGLVDAALLGRFAHSSLRGTQVDGDITLDAQGSLRIDAGLRRLFEYFLSLSGEFDLAAIRRLLALHLADGQHPDTVINQVLAVFDRYVGLRQATAMLPDEGDLGTRLTALQALRRQWFGDDADALFGTDEAHTEYTLQRMAIAGDASLDATERSAQLAALDAQRPLNERMAEQDALSAVIADEQTRQLDHIGADAAQRHAERSALWGEAAAARLAELDTERERWDQRLIDYQRARDRLLSDPGLDHNSRQEALARLRQQHFDEAERRRIASLEAIDALPSGG